MKERTFWILFMLNALFLISYVSSLYAGDCSTAVFPNENLVELNVTGNSSNLDGFTWNKSGSLIIYCFNVAFKPDNFTLTWFNTEKVTVKSQSGGSGGNEYQFGGVINKSKPEIPENITIPENGSKEAQAQNQAGGLPSERNNKLWVIPLFLIIFLFIGIILYFLKKTLLNNR